MPSNIWTYLSVHLFFVFVAAPKNLNKYTLFPSDKKRYGNALKDFSLLLEINVFNTCKGSYIGSALTNFRFFVLCCHVLFLLFHFHRFFNKLLSLPKLQRIIFRDQTFLVIIVFLQWYIFEEKGSFFVSDLD